MLKSFFKNNKHIKIIVGILLFGLILGILYFLNLSEDAENSIITTLNNYDTFRYNAILKELIIMSSILVLSFFIVGIPLGIFYIFYEGISLGFIISAFSASFKLKGFIYILLYILVNKILSLILIIFFIYKIIGIGRYVIGIFIYKGDSSIKEKIFLNFKNSLYIILFVLIINIILYFLSYYLFDYLSILIK